MYGKSAGFSSGAKKTNGEKVHDTQKTIEVITKIIIDSTQEGDTVLDAFAGSATTSLVSRELNRNIYAFELDLKNFEIARKRAMQGLVVQPNFFRV
ncbi:site-specific DNA-methyltransferase (adenine-specific)/modification methylase [Flexibacter flexilis DSM 6793]|uniref:Site-specific DNA-methyltransferase (Adenine-specific)/modification methylase n=1 Tax=Flexibacter flexilis DSM 6793 TaxID=927664 RepID=A0A1I1MNK8_9BACT|nr:DNA methyltransferase [Flexibacter flexilis]SFC86686.1 site-specific DNA-methyltransferase (adenine-specific)/modification methylase [Flexibacter flexilis DSM 6793]